MGVRYTNKEFIDRFPALAVKLGLKATPQQPKWIQDILKDLPTDQPADPEKKNKYRNKFITIDGIKFQSQREGNYYLQLKQLQRAGIVKSFDRQVKYILQEGYKKNGHKIQAITYLMDFQVYYSDGHIEYIDTKGVRTEVFNIKKKILEYKYPEITLKLL